MVTRTFVYTSLACAGLVAASVLTAAYPLADARLPELKARSACYVAELAVRGPRQVKDAATLRDICGDQIADPREMCRTCQTDAECVDWCGGEGEF